MKRCLSKTVGFQASTFFLGKENEFFFNLSEKRKFVKFSWVFCLFICSGGFFICGLAFFFFLLESYS